MTNLYPVHVQCPLYLCVEMCSNRIENGGLNGSQAHCMCDCDVILPHRTGWEIHYDNCRTRWNNKDSKKYQRNADGTLRLPNENILKLKVDVLYHLGLDTHNYDLPAMFGDVKFVCMGGTKYRMREFAAYIQEILDLPREKLVNLTKHSHRYAMFKVRPVLSVSHGIGIPSMTILLQEIIKLMHYSKAKNPIFFRIGTSGGLKIPPGSVVISSWGMNGTLQKSYDIPILGKVRQIPTQFDRRLCQELSSLTCDTDGFETHVGGTMAADDFYRGITDSPLCRACMGAEETAAHVLLECGGVPTLRAKYFGTPRSLPEAFNNTNKLLGFLLELGWRQARLDGPFCDFTEPDKLAFLQRLSDLGVKNIEMEATAFAAMSWEAGVRAGDVCVTLINRLEGDQVTPSKATMLEWQKRPMIIVGRYIKEYFKNK